jgi:uncharacterized membrane protein (UPF0127 family)
MALVHKKRVLAGDVVFYRNLFLRSLGLRFSRPIRDKALVLVSPYESVYNSSIDMFFVFFSIDVLWLDSNLKVVDLRRGVKPFSLVITPKAPAMYVVELPNGSIKNVDIGDAVSFS